jgi:hypothetical protein
MWYSSSGLRSKILYAFLDLPSWLHRPFNICAKQELLQGALSVVFPIRIPLLGITGVLGFVHVRYSKEHDVSDVGSIPETSWISDDGQSFEYYTPSSEPIDCVILLHSYEFWCISWEKILAALLTQAGGSSPASGQWVSRTAPWWPLTQYAASMRTG